MLLCFSFTSWKTCDWLLCLWEAYIFMSQLFVHWTVHTGDVNRFQSKTKDKHVDLIYTYDFVIAGTSAEFIQIGCYPFNFWFFYIFFYFKITLWFVVIFPSKYVYCFLRCFYEHVGDFSVENHTYIILIVGRVVWMSLVLGRFSVSWHLIYILEK